MSRSMDATAATADDDDEDAVVAASFRVDVIRSERAELNPGCC